MVWMTFSKLNVANSSVTGYFFTLSSRAIIQKTFATLMVLPTSKSLTHFLHSVCIPWFSEYVHVCLRKHSQWQRHGESWRKGSMMSWMKNELLHPKNLSPCTLFPSEFHVCLRVLSSSCAKPVGEKERFRFGNRLSVSIRALNLLLHVILFTSSCRLDSRWRRHSCSRGCSLPKITVMYSLCASCVVPLHLTCCHGNSM